MKVSAAPHLRVVHRKMVSPAEAVAISAFVSRNPRSATILPH